MTKQELINQLIKEAKKHLGENGITINRAYNKIKKSERGSVSDNSPYCASFLSVIMHESGLDKIGAIEAYIPYMETELRKNKAKIIPKGNLPQVGDICTFDWKNDGTRDHIGLVVAVSGTKITTLEGNMSNGLVGYRTFGSNWAYIEHFLRMNWEAIATRPAPKPKPATTAPKGSYIVKKGDTLGAIATKYKTTWQALAKLNNIKDANLIYPGQVLKLSSAAPTVYTVKKGDSLSKIATKYRTTWQSLAKLNKIKDPNVIYPGQKLRIK